MITLTLTDQQLLSVEKPGRYTGGEVNSVSKVITPGITRFAFCFPDVYEVGMSHLGLQILYFFLNRREDTFCERVFMPWFDMMDVMRQDKIPLFALETGNELKQFDFLGFTLQYEMSYTNVLAMLDLADIPLRSIERGDEYPIVCAGGPCATNPEPMTEFVDFFYIGDGEASLDAILDEYSRHKAAGGGKKDFLRQIMGIPGVYVPAFYETEYGDDGRITAFNSIDEEVPKMVKRAFMPGLDYFPESFITPLIETVHNRAVLEIARGCMRGCRYCQAGFIYRPLRERDVPDLLGQAVKLLDATGHEEISLLSLSACDHSDFMALLDGLLEITKKRQVNISLPSLRLDAVSLSALAKTQSVRKSSLTVAPEAGSQRMRDIINKNLTEEEILQGCRNAFLAGFDRIKLYFMAGLPFEGGEDLKAIGKLCEDVVETYYTLTYEERKRPVSVAVSTACFVPKPFTPFQWAGMTTPEEFSGSQQELKRGIRKKQISYKYHDAKTAQIEGVLAKGDRRLGQAIYEAYRMGAVFDGWTEHFKYDTWLMAFEKAGLDPYFYAHRERETDEIFPWDFIEMGMSKEFLRLEWERAQTGKTTLNCRDGCAGCGCGC